MLTVRSLCFDVCMYALMGVMGILCAPMAIWSARGANRAIQAYCAVVLWLLRKICGLEVEVRGAVPEGDVLVASKHQSFLDIIVLSHRLPRVSFVMKRELRWAPILGLYALRIGSTPVARGQRARAMKDMVSRVGRAGADPRQLVIYPQGTRVPPGVRAPYKIGAGVLYERLGKTCVPAATNAGVFWSRRSHLRRPGTAVVEFLAPMAAGLPIETFMARLEAAVETESDRLMREAGFDPDRPPKAAS